MHIREAVAQESAPATLKAAFLEPVSRGLATDLSVHLFARTDQHFMSWFTCALLLSPAGSSALCQDPLDSSMLKNQLHMQPGHRLVQS